MAGLPGSVLFCCTYNSIRSPMAEGLLKSWNARPSVSSVTIAAGSHPKAGATEHATVADVAGGSGVSWTETEDALPMPFSFWKQNRGLGSVDLVLRSSDLADALNNEQLKVTGLKSGVYTLKIDGQSIGNFNNDELARGVNLALLDTPMAKQAAEVYTLTVAHCNVHNERWRTVQVPLADDNLPGAEKAMAAADELEKQILEKRSQAAKPKPHLFELTPAA